MLRHYANTGIRVICRQDVRLTAGAMHALKLHSESSWARLGKPPATRFALTHSTGLANRGWFRNLAQYRLRILLYAYRCNRSRAPTRSDPSHTSAARKALLYCARRGNAESGASVGHEMFNPSNNSFRPWLRPAALYSRPDQDLRARRNPRSSRHFGE
jgi:hypothetical protein